jgi:DNA-binding response OmpR family regulator
VDDGDLIQAGSSARILVVVGHENHAERLTPVLRSDGYELETVLSLSLPLPSLSATPDLAIVWFPYASPDALPQLENIIRAIQAVGNEPPLPVLLIVDEDGARWVEPSFGLNVADVLMRPIHPLMLRQRVRLLLRARQTERIIGVLRHQVEEQQRRRMISALDTALHMFQDDAFLEEPKVDAASQAACLIRIGQDLLFDAEAHSLVSEAGHSTAPTKTALTASQASILSYMVSHPYRALGNQEIAQAALGYKNIDECQAQAIVRPHILRLRRKLEDDIRHPQILRTVRGSGYIFSPD